MTGKRIRNAAVVYAAAFALTSSLSSEIWMVFSAPAIPLLQYLGQPAPPTYVGPTPFRMFTDVYVPAIVALFLASPILFRLLWLVILPRIDPRERHWATAFLAVNATVFIGAGLFAFFYVFPRYLQYMYEHMPGCTLT